MMAQLVDLTPILVFLHENKNHVQIAAWILFGVNLVGHIENIKKIIAERKLKEKQLSNNTNDLNDTKPDC